MQYCRKCGAQLADDAGFCTKCGQKAGSQAMQVYLPPEASSAASNKHAIWYGVGIAGILIVSGLIAFFAAQNTRTLLGPQTTKKIEARIPVPAEPSQSTLSQLPTPTANTGALVEFRTSVQAKERINTDIIDLASQVNSRLGQSGTLRYSQDLRDRARTIINEIPQYSSRLSERSYPAEFQSAKSLLLQLFDLETTRARSLYNGLTEGLNGQDYQSSFSVGTKAAYEFDDLNARFVKEYSTLDKR